MLFDWDESKNQSNLAKHGLDFAGAAPLFAPDGQLLTVPDRRKDYGEDRSMGFGRLANRVVAVCFTVGGQIVRIISLRKANQRETKAYNQTIEKIRQRQKEGKGNKSGELRRRRGPQHGQ